ncbi:hypothetical protein BCR44DRAFT_1132873 [Catenaria anguillulae PL171]|uniref:Uncharacterized protein n=1 Tax=Catenaria anguillulae PL171 TaxID=765915 RepID=A0A1Y2HKN3_9FUNG|nr:hypothetical protein BCR44DRAFT_1132873 [Catenaria anguillulae PL171]
MSTSPPRTASQSQAIMTEPPANTASGIPSSSPLLPAPHAPNLAKSRRSRPNAATIRRTQQAQARAQRERDRARAVDAQTHQVAHPLEDYLEHIRFNEARLDRTRTGPGSHMPVVGAAADSATAVSLYYEEDPAALDFGLPVTVYDLAAAMVHDYCARHAASVGGVATAASAATSPI